MQDSIPSEYAPAGDGLDLAPFHKLMKRLRHPEYGCPWDKSRTLATMGKTIREEAEEAAEALDGTDYAHQAEELGDVLLNVMLAVVIAEEEGRYAWRDVIETVSAKLIRRHPHVFGGAAAANPEEALRLFREAKAKEKGRGERGISPPPLDIS